MTDETAFAAAVAQKSKRPELLSALRADPVLLQKARDKVRTLAQMQERGQIFDRDWISREQHSMLTAMIAQVEADRDEPPAVRIA